MAFSASASVPCPVKLLAGRSAGRVRLRCRCSHTDGLRDASGTPTRGTYAREAEREAELAAAAAAAAPCDAVVPPARASARAAEPPKPHCWFVCPLQSQIATAVPADVSPPARSTHLLASDVGRAEAFAASCALDAR
jgi:hypothetical protein